MSDTAGCSAILERAAAWIIDAIGNANLCCRALGYLGRKRVAFSESVSLAV
jgi:hypothetical protein